MCVWNSNVYPKISIVTYLHFTHPQLRINEGVDPPADSQREADFQRNRQYMTDIVKRIVRARREGKDTTELPFIDALLQSGVPEKQVEEY